MQSHITMAVIASTTEGMTGNAASASRKIHHVVGKFVHHNYPLEVTL
jgi:hypothetical protein